MLVMALAYAFTSEARYLDAVSAGMDHIRRAIVVG